MKINVKNIDISSSEIIKTIDKNFKIISTLQQAKFLSLESVNINQNPFYFMFCFLFRNFHSNLQSNNSFLTLI